MSINIQDAMRLEAQKLKLRREGEVDPKDWARRIFYRNLNGERIAPCTLLFAKQALKLDEK